MKIFYVAKFIKVIKENNNALKTRIKTTAESEFEKYRVIQDKTYQSDFDKLLFELENKNK